MKIRVEKNSTLPGFVFPTFTLTLSVRSYVPIILVSLSPTTLYLSQMFRDSHITIT